METYFVLFYPLFLHCFYIDFICCFLGLFLTLIPVDKFRYFTSSSAFDFIVINRMVMCTTDTDTDKSEQRLDQKHARKVHISLFFAVRIVGCTHAAVLAVFAPWVFSCRVGQHCRRVLIKALNRLQPERTRTPPANETRLQHINLNYKCSRLMQHFALLWVAGNLKLPPHVAKNPVTGAVHWYSVVVR